MAASLLALERPRFCVSNTVFKNGPLFISSKGLGWKSWKKRWFILTRTSLVFFKNDPSSLPLKGGEVNLTLGGIDLNNSGSVVVREEKKLLTVLSPDGRDGRAFTLKAETLEDLYEWKVALEQALAQAPNAAVVMGHNAIFQAETNDAIEGSFGQWRYKRPIKSLVVGRPVLFALEDIDGSSSFLEKALQFLEKYGTGVEGILRQSADVEEVVCRIQEYEQGKKEFSPDEDPHVIGDCVKHVLRELPSSPVPASCCTALLEAYKIDCMEARIGSLRAAIVETLPEPNRRLLQRILKMMHTISSHSYENRMTSSAVAACMAPLLLHPLLAGECDQEDDFDTDGDISVQLLAAANAANNAQAIVVTLLEDYENIFDDGDLQRCSISADSHGNSGPENTSDEEDIEVKHANFCNAETGVDWETNDDNEVTLSGKLSESSEYAGSDLYDYKGFGIEDSDIESPRDIHCSIESSDLPMDPLARNSTILVNNQEGGEEKQNEDPIKSIEISSASLIDKHCQSLREILTSGTTHAASGLASSTEKQESKITGSTVNSKRLTFWGRGNVGNTPENGSCSSGDDELGIQRLEIAKNDLRQRIAKEARGNAILEASLERKKQALHERRLALEQDVTRLQEQLQAERDLRAALEIGLSMSCGQCSSRYVDSKMRAELEEIAFAEADVARLKQKVGELHHQLNQQRQHHFISVSNILDYHLYPQNHNSQMRFLQQDFDSSLAFFNHERKQRTGENILGAEWRNSRSPGANSTQLHCGQMMEYQRHYYNPSAALLESTSRLDLFKERRLQLTEQLQNLDVNNGSSCQDFIRRPSSPPWN